MFKPGSRNGAHSLVLPNRLNSDGRYIRFSPNVWRSEIITGLLFHGFLILNQTILASYFPMIKLLTAGSSEHALRQGIGIAHDIIVFLHNIARHCARAAVGVKHHGVIRFDHLEFEFLLAAPITASHHIRRIFARSQLGVGNTVRFRIFNIRHCEIHICRIVLCFAL